MSAYRLRAGGSAVGSGVVRRLGRRVVALETELAELNRGGDRQLNRVRLLEASPTLDRLS